MPKLLQVNVTANWGSTGKIAEQIGWMAMAKGWESYIAYGRMMNPSKSKLIKIGNQWDVYTHYTLGRFFDMEGLASKRATRKLVREIEHVRPDVIHLHNIHDHYLNYPILFEYLVKANIPVVWTQHDQWTTTGHCTFNLVDCEKWKSRCNKCPIKEKWALDRSERNYDLKKEWFAAVKSLVVVPVSEWLGREIKQSFLKDKPMKVIKNGIDIEMFQPRHVVDVRQKYGLGQEKIILGVASEWSVRKGLKDFYHLSKMLPRDKYVILIVGKILGEIQEIPLDGCKIVFVDRTQNALELSQIYSIATVFVNPTYQDNYPTTNLEAMACGTPVITYNTGGSPEAIDAETGWAIEQGDVTSIATIIKSIELKDNREKEKQRNACRTRAEQEFDKAKCFEKYFELYEELICSEQNDE